MTFDPDRDLATDRILLRARTFLEPGARDGARVLERLGQRIATSPVSAPNGPPGAEPREMSAGSARTLRTGTLPRWLELTTVGLVTGVVGFFIGFSAGDDRAVVGTALVNPAGVSTSAVNTAAPEPASNAPNSNLAGAEQNVAALEPRASTPAPPPSRAAARARAATSRSHGVQQPAAGEFASSDLSRVLRVLRSAERARRDDRTLEARELLSELDRNIDASVLSEERLVARALVECDLGNVREARRLATQLEKDSADSIYRRRMQGSCAEPQ